MRYFHNHKIRLATSFILLACLVSCSQRKQTKTILVLATTENFGLYTGEILKAEGFNHFTMQRFDDNVTTYSLKQYDIVILAQGEITQDQIGALTQYVEDGGNLIAFRPDKKLQQVFGLKEISENINANYVGILGDNEITKGITKETLQLHSQADAYALAESNENTIAQLFDSNTSKTNMPAIIWHQFGKGHTLAFTYNLPENIVYTRQGNIAHAGLEKDGILGLRAMDLFTNGFVDSTKNILNQADEQMRILTHGIEQMTMYTKPTPRFWYFPDSLKCIVTLNNDGEDSKEEEFLDQFNDVKNHGAAMTLYVKETELISKKQIDSWMADGFEISGHPDDTRQAVLPDWQTMDSVYKNIQARLQSQFGISEMKTITNHWFVWVCNNADGTPNFAAQASIEEANGVGLDCNYAHYDNGSNQGHFLGAMGSLQGNYTGSGLSMKFADNKGDVIQVYQQLNNVYDQQYMEHKDSDGYFNAFKGLLDRSIDDEVYSSISIRAHNNEYYFSKVPLMKMLDYAKSKGTPVWTELSWLEFLEAKDEATFQDIEWDGSKLSFSIHSKLSFKGNLGSLLPLNTNAGQELEYIDVNGSNAPFKSVNIKGTDYAMFMIKPGTNHTVNASYKK